jgi:hypothetical protein
MRTTRALIYAANSAKSIIELITHLIALSMFAVCAKALPAYITSAMPEVLA